jgi:arsenate reductase
MARARLLIVCTGNSARSQIAEGLFRHEAGERFEVFSAGTEPAHVRPEAVQVMDEIGIDISQQTSKSVDAFSGQHFDLVITVCDKAREKCPVFPHPVQVLHWPFDDPARAPEGSETRITEFRRVRDRIHSRIMVFLGEIAPGLERGSVGQ